MKFLCFFEVLISLHVCISCSNNGKKWFKLNVNSPITNTVHTAYWERYWCIPYLFSPQQNKRNSFNAFKDVWSKRSTSILRNQCLFSSVLVGHQASTYHTNPSKHIMWRLPQTFHSGTHPKTGLVPYRWTRACVRGVTVFHVPSGVKKSAVCCCSQPMGRKEICQEETSLHVFTFLILDRYAYHW